MKIIIDFKNKKIEKNKFEWFKKAFSSLFDSVKIENVNYVLSNDKATIPMNIEIFLFAVKKFESIMNLITDPIQNSFSNRTANALCNAEIHSIADLIDFRTKTTLKNNKNPLTSLRGLGQQSINEIEKFLIDNNLN